MTLRPRMRLDGFLFAGTKGLRKKPHGWGMCRAGFARAFQSLAERDAWEARMIRCRFVPGGLEKQMDVPGSSVTAPFLHSVDPMSSRLQINALKGATSKSPGDSCIEVVYPLKDDHMLRTSVSDVGEWSSFRLSKFYEAVDALTADVAYRHCGGLEDSDLALVTAGHYFSRKIRRTEIDQDVILRTYVTMAGFSGSSSLEIRCDATQIDQLSGEEKMVNVCHTVMVALDAKTMRPAKNRVPELQLSSIPADDGQDERAAIERLDLARFHADFRKQRAKKSMQLRQNKIFAPPTEEEMRLVHKLHHTVVRAQEQAAPRPLPPRRVKELTFRSSFATFPENRNVHGKLFGGFVMSQGYNIALYAAKVYAKGNNVVSLGIDQAVFMQPISPQGDLVTFTASLVHATENTCRVLVVAEVRDQTDTGRLPLRSNRLMFVFATQGPRTSDKRQKGVVPYEYHEILGFLDAERRYRAEGPTEEFAGQLLSELNRSQETDEH